MAKMKRVAADKVTLDVMIKIIAVESTVPKLSKLSVRW